MLIFCDETLNDQNKSQRMIGKMLYLIISTPDISYSVQALRQFLQSLKKYHINVALKVIKYVERNLGLGI